MASRAAPPRGRAGGAALALALLAVAAPVAAEEWPQCQEKGQVFRHAGVYGLFTDVVAVGAKEGCWLSDCTRSDKFICASSAECGVACSSVEGCEFWSYEPGIRKCFLRKSDAGRESDAAFVSGSKLCRPSPAQRGDVRPGPPSPLQPSEEVRIALPFAQAALWASQLPALQPCNAGVGAPGCDNPYAAMGVWRYAVNNLRLAVAGLPAEERARHSSTLQYISQVAVDIANFFQQPTGETFQIAVGNAGAIFEALRGWLQTAAPVEVGLPGDAPAAPHLPTGHSAELPDGAALGPVAARIKLADGQQMPMIGFGTWQLLGQQAYDATLSALSSGYRHIDTAQAYQNEREVGLAIRDSGVPRRELFLATKLSDPSEFNDLERRFEEQLAALGTDYLDLYMLHSPSDRNSMETAWRSMEALQAQGKIRSLGVSNFGPKELDELLSFARVRPMYVQNKFSVYSPGEQQVGGQSMLAYAQKQGIVVMGYSVINPWPLLLPPMEDPLVRAIAMRYGRSPAQVLHRWALQLGVSVIPKSATPTRIAENAQLLDFRLSEPDVRLLSGLVTLSESMAGAFAPAWADDVFGLRALSS